LDRQNAYQLCFKMPLSTNEVVRHELRIVVVMGGWPRFEIERRHSLDFGSLVVETLKYHNYDVVGLTLVERNDLEQIRHEKQSVIFNALIGRFGEDGEFASFLENNKISFTGCDSLAGSLLMDKARLKLFVYDLEIKTPAFQIIDYQLWSKRKSKLVSDATLQEFYNPDRINPKMKLPIYVKGNFGSFNMGGAIISREEQLEDALRTAGEIDNKVILEEYIIGVDAHVPILNGEPMAVIERATEVLDEGDFLSSPFNFKVRENHFHIPGRFTRQVTEQMTNITRKVYGELRLRGLCRADFRVSRSGEVFMLEMNSQHSIRKNRMAIMAALAYGLQPIELIEEIIDHRWVP